MAFKKIYLDPENKTFAEVMSNGKSYAVPAFQRGYSWEEEQLDELWQDQFHRFPAQLLRYVRKTQT